MSTRDNPLGALALRRDRRMGPADQAQLVAMPDRQPSPRNPAQELASRITAPEGFYSFGFRGPASPGRAIRPFLFKPSEIIFFSSDDDSAFDCGIDTLLQIMEEGRARTATVPDLSASVALDASGVGKLSIGGAPSSPAGEFFLFAIRMSGALTANPANATLGATGQFATPGGLPWNPNNFRLAVDSNNVRSLYVWAYQLRGTKVYPAWLATGPNQVLGVSCSGGASSGSMMIDPITARHSEYDAIHQMLKCL